MIEAKVQTRTRLIEVEFKQGRKLRCRDYLSKQRMRRQFRGGLLIVSQIKETVRLFTRLRNEQDMLHEKDYIGAVTKARKDEDLLALQGVPEGLNNLHNFTSREVSQEILNCGGGFLPRRYGSTGARERYGGCCTAEKASFFLRSTAELQKSQQSSLEATFVRLSPSANCLQFSLRWTQSPKVSTPRRIRQLSDISRITHGSIFSSANRLESVESPTF